MELKAKKLHKFMKSLEIIKLRAVKIEEALE